MALDDRVAHQRLGVKRVSLLLDHELPCVRKFSETVWAIR